jgi:menaquinone-dependent protoporphyrinogen IX oxidase
MKGAIFFSSKYGSTAQYASWISEATGLPLYDMQLSSADPSQFDYLILGSPIIYFKLWNYNWVRNNLNKIKHKPILYYTVSGAPAGPKLDGWIAKSLPAEFITKMNHVALGGRQVPKELSFYDRVMLRIGAFFNSDPKARKEELKGFDFMDKSSIQPILEFVQQQEKPVVIHA